MKAKGRATSSAIISGLFKVLEVIALKEIVNAIVTTTKNHARKTKLILSLDNKSIKIIAIRNAVIIKGRILKLWPGSISGDCNPKGKSGEVAFIFSPSIILSGWYEFMIYSPMNCVTRNIESIITVIFRTCFIKSKGEYGF